MGEKKTKSMLYSILVEIEVEVGVELGNTQSTYMFPIKTKYMNSFIRKREC